MLWRRVHARNRPDVVVCLIRVNMSGSPLEHVASYAKYLCDRYHALLERQLADPRPIPLAPRPLVWHQDTANWIHSVFSRDMRRLVVVCPRAYCFLVAQNLVDKAQMILEQGQFAYIILHFDGDGPLIPLKHATTETRPGGGVTEETVLNLLRKALEKVRVVLFPLFLTAPNQGVTLSAGHQALGR